MHEQTGADLFGPYFDLVTKHKLSIFLTISQNQRPKQIHSTSLVSDNKISFDLFVYHPLEDVM